MPHPNVTTRHARHALHLLISGALRDIDAEFNEEREHEQQEATVRLFDELADEAGQWEIIPSRAYQADLMIEEMRAILADSTHPARETIRALLAEHNLLP
jgi:hypothetical protein